MQKIGSPAFIFWSGVGGHFHNRGNHLSGNFLVTNTKILSSNLPPTTFKNVRDKSTKNQRADPWKKKKKNSFNFCYKKIA